MEIARSERSGEDRGKDNPLSAVRWELLGFAFHPTWIYLLFYGSGEIAASLRPDTTGTEPYDAVYYASVAALALTLLIGLLATKRLMRFALTPAMALGAPLLASAGTLLYVANGTAAGMALVGAGGVLTGFGSALLAMRWAALFGRFPFRALMENFTLLLLIIVALCLSTGYLPRESQLVLLVCLPLASGSCLIVGEHRLRGKDEERTERSDADDCSRPIAAETDSRRRHDAMMRRMALLVGGVAVIGSTAALLGIFTDNDERFDFGGWFYLIATTLALILAAGCLRRCGRGEFLALFVAPAGALLVLLLPQMRLSTSFMASVVYPIGAIVFELLLLITAVIFAHRYDYSPAKCFMAARLSFALSDAAGTLLGAHLLAHSDSLAIAYLASLLLMVGSEALIAVAAVIAFANRPRKAPEAIAPEAAPAASSHFTAAPLTPHEAIVARCAALQKQFSLSEREGDVLVLIAEGRSSARIQEDLTIAAGTVNYHMRNIYAKLGVHSRQEVIDLVLGNDELHSVL